MSHPVETKDPLEAGREAARRYLWREAFDLLTEADHSAPLSPDDLDRLAEAAWWIGRMDACIGARERAYAGFLEAGEPTRAARMALGLARDHRYRLDAAISNAWFRRAERLLDEAAESVEHGYLERARAQQAIGAGDLEAALEHARRALDIGMRFGDRDLQAISLHDQGEALVSLGRVEEGLALTDEATVAAVGGELGPWATGVVYCNTITVCERLADYRRAGEWTEAAKRWCERQAISGFPGICRVHRADVIRLRGRWAEAEEEARTACAELSESGMLAFAGEGFYEVGEIRLRMGDHEAAEDAFRQAHELGRDPQPGLALLRLAQGNVSAASAGVRRALEETTDRLHRAKLLPAAADVALSEGDLDAAGRAAEELASIADDFGSPALQAEAALARGAVEIARGDVAAACRTLRRSWQLWQEVDAPYEAARARVLLGLAYRGEGDEEEATLQLAAAKAAFDRLGAIPDARRAAEALGPAGRTTAPPSRVRRTFMFTDIVRSTNLVEAMGDEAWADLLRWHDDTLRALFREHGGEEVDHPGDGFFVAFDTPALAIECARAIQRKLADHRRTHGFAPGLRVGIHAAEAAAAGGGYRGKGVHAAARVGALAEAGEILVSRETLEAAGEGRFPTAGSREVALKGLSAPLDVVAVQWR